MKVEAKRGNPPPAPFVPVTVTLTCETREELDSLYEIANWSHQVATKIVELRTGLLRPSDRKVTVGSINDVGTAIFSNLYRNDF